MTETRAPKRSATEAIALARWGLAVLSEEGRIHMLAGAVVTCAPQPASPCANS